MGDFLAKDIDFIHHIIDDIEYLRELSLYNKKVASEIRRASVIIRRFVLDNDLKQAASLARMKLELMLPPPFKKKGEYEKTGIKLAHTALNKMGDGDYFGFTCNSMAILINVQPDTKFEACSLDQFLKQNCFYYHGDFISRRDVINYAANSMGGAHHGNRPVKNKEIIEKAKGCILFTPTQGNKFNIDIELARLHNYHDEIYPDRSGINLVHMEILSSARLISHSPMIQVLVNKLKKTIQCD